MWFISLDMTMLKMLHENYFERNNHQVPLSLRSANFILIEGIWAVVKVEIASLGSHKNLLSIRNTLLNAFKNKIDSQVIIRLWRRAVEEHLKTLINILSLTKEYN